MTPEEYIKIKYEDEWYKHIDPKVAMKFHARNVKRCQEAIAHHEKKDRPIEVLAIFGSGRDTSKSCAYEKSNSQLLLEKAIDIALPMKGTDVVVDKVHLRSKNIEPCNGCVSTNSAHCGFPCNCFPLDPMQDMYPKVLRCDVMLMATPVNQSMPSTRVKAFLDRLVSLDGGFYVSPEQFAPKDGKWKDKTAKLSSELSESGNLPYDQRMFGRVAGYFISSKDEDNQMKDELMENIEEGSYAGYAKSVAGMLYHSNADYGFFHPKKYYVTNASKADEEYMWDKENMLSKEDLFAEASQLVKDCVDMASHLRENPPKWHGGSRKNRT